MDFRTTRRVRFSDCDPAGLMFFPQYLVMVNGLVEQWFDEALQIPYAGVIGARRTGLPTARLEADFTAVTRHGETLALTLAVEKLGRSSLILRHAFSGDDGMRCRVRQVIVCTSQDSHRSQPLPDDIRHAIEPYVEPAAP